MNQEKPMERIELSNGLYLNLYDRSRQIAADLWQVVLSAEIEIPVRTVMQQHAAEPGKIDDVAAALGDVVFYRQTRERNFIDGNNKDEALEELKNVYLNNVRRYLAHPGFGVKFVARAFQEASKKGRNLLK